LLQLNILCTFRQEPQVGKRKQTGLLSGTGQYMDRKFIHSADRFSLREILYKLAECKNDTHFKNNPTIALIVPPGTGIKKYD